MNHYLRMKLYIQKPPILNAVCFALRDERPTFPTVEIFPRFHPDSLRLALLAQGKPSCSFLQKGPRSKQDSNQQKGSYLTGELSSIESDSYWQLIT